MKAIERKRYHQPVIKVIKVKLIPLMDGSNGDNTSTDTGGSINRTRGFVFEDEE